MNKANKSAAAASIARSCSLNTIRQTIVAGCWSGPGMRRKLRQPHRRAEKSRLKGLLLLQQQGQVQAETEACFQQVIAVAQ